VEECGLCPIFTSFTLAFALQLRKEHRKISVRVRETSVRLRETSVRVQYTYYQNTHTVTKTHAHKHTHIPCILFLLYVGTIHMRSPCFMHFCCKAPCQCIPHLNLCFLVFVSIPFVWLHCYAKSYLFHPSL
jgi:hypothetical protein